MLASGSDGVGAARAPFSTRPATVAPHAGHSWRGGSPGGRGGPRRVVGIRLAGAPSGRGRGGPRAANGPSARAAAGRSPRWRWPSWARPSTSSARWAATPTARRPWRHLSARGVTMHVAWREEPTRRAITYLVDGGERTIVVIGPRLDPAGRGRAGLGAARWRRGRLSHRRGRRARWRRRAGPACWWPPRACAAALQQAAVDARRARVQRGRRRRGGLGAAAVGPGPADGGHPGLGRAAAGGASRRGAGRRRRRRDRCATTTAPGTRSRRRSCTAWPGRSVADAAALGARAGARALTRVGAP